MANQTIYPYGTNGSLPSSVGIINDCVTGGADKALAAEQGKVLGEMVFPMDDAMPRKRTSPTGTEDVSLDSVSFVNKVPGGASNTKRAVSSTITVPRNATGLHMKLSSGYLGIIYFLRNNGTWDEDIDSSGEFAQESYCAVPSSYNSGGVWLYIRKENGDSTITTTEAKNSISELYWDVAGIEYLPVASKEFAQKEISILFIGNSLTQDAVSYVPYLLCNLYPNLSFKFYIWYNGGYTLAQQYAKFTSNGKAEIFSVCENVASWTNYNNSVTMESILSTYQFDIVCLQEYFNYKSSYTTSDLIDFNNVVSYIQQNYQKEFKVVTLFHAPLRSSAQNVYNLTKSGNELILKNTTAESMLAPGIAIYDALSTELDSLGDQGHLSPDGTHAQEGLPCLLEAFVVYLWIMRQLAIPVSIENTQIRMTTDIYDTLSIPGPNLGTGVIPGTDAQNLLAQQVAIIANKKGAGIENDVFINQE